MKKTFLFGALCWLGMTVSAQEIEIGFPQHKKEWTLGLERTHAAYAVTTHEGKRCVLLESYLNHKDPRGGCSHLTCKISRPGQKFKELRVEVWSVTNAQLVVRFIDGTRQVHQYRFAVKDAGWQTVVCRFDTKIPNAPVNIWGGKCDRKWHDPVTAISLVADNNGGVRTSRDHVMNRIYFGRVTLICD